MLPSSARSLFLAPLACAGFALPAVAEDPAPTRFSAEVSAGLAADSDVGLAELDQTTRQGDLAAVLGLKLDAEAHPTGKLTLRGGYELSDTRYQDFDAFNLQLHRLFADAEYDFGDTTAGVLYTYVDARLDGDGYLTLQQASPYLTHLFGNRLLLRGAYALTERDYDTEPGRNSTSDEAQLDAYILLDGTRQYVVLGGKGGQTEADDDVFSYDNAGVKARYVQRASAFGKDVKFNAGADFEARDYALPSPGQTGAREDKMASANAGVQVAVAGPLSVDVNYEYRQRDSNLAAADYEENLGTVALKLNF